ncbi:hypothetical protein CEUSTIGMA_g12474.t1 [Chlamydomonas eustigma]|uniref:Transcription elongation factor SPT5 n=1 Tax=Chlamydomonas eustigma TaxID=1157962 RepID=A0A250XPP0_9CHLO|nr:hypothetical protein CEUSTIGMA_g12474.t1 [Chlamydomonas eustigma]|eukprot:GAX85054.1 hypothetical protein CEUSTIGMA_g12474.t1 [Chlamydomonas eustigma]
MGKDEVDEVEEDLEDEEDDSDFNGEDSEYEDVEEADEDKKEKKVQAKRGGRDKKRRVAADDDEEEEDVGSRRKKRSVFIDDIADVDDDDEEEEIDEDAEDLIDDRDVDLPDAAAAPSQANYRLLAGRDRDREEMKEDEIARYYEDRFKHYDEGGSQYDDQGVEAGTVSQQGLLPTINDPKLWMVKCRPGHEREACTQLLQKYYTLHAEGLPLMIKSAFTLDHLKGYLYVEAEKEAHVKDAIKGLRSMFYGKGVKLVPLAEMVDAITVNRKAKMTIARDNWVRVKGGLYKDDLAKVVEVDSSAQRVTIRLLPRLDLMAMANRDESERKKFPFGKQPSVRPPSKPFNVEEARQLALSVSRAPGPEGQSYLMLGSHRFINGYVERTVAIKFLMVLDGMPPLEEMSRFNAAGLDPEGQGNAGGGAGDLSSLMATLPADASQPKAKFNKGDKVVFLRGELQNLEAVVTDVREDGKIMVMPNIEGFTDSVDCDSDELRKLFLVGDRVRVMNGQHSGESGMLIHILSNDRCVVISDLSREEINVFLRDLTQHEESDTGVEILGPYQLHDLVQLDQTTAGVIIKIEKASAMVLSSESTLEKPDIRVCTLPDITRKVLGRNIITMDRNGNKVQINDLVTVVEGPSTVKGKSGTVEYVWRGALFIKGKQLSDASRGFLCVRAKACTVRGGTNTAADLARLAASGTPRSTPQSPAHAGGGARIGYAPQSPLARGLGGEVKPPPPRMVSSQPGSRDGGKGGHGRSPAGVLVNKVIRVVGGAYNGYRGRVKQESDTHVQVEFDAINKVSTVDKKMVRVEGAPAAANGPGGGFGRSNPGMPQPRSGFGGSASQQSGFGRHNSQDYGSSQLGSYGTRTPMHPSMTPMHHFGSGSSTPSHPSMTPMHAPYTPMHQANTPMDDNYMMLGGGGGRPGEGRSQDIGAGSYMPAPTPGQAYTPAAFTPAYTPSAYGGDAAPTPGILDQSGNTGAAYPGDIGHQANTPYIPGSTPRGGLLASDSGSGGLVGNTPGYRYTPAGMTPGTTAPTPGIVGASTPAFTPGGGMPQTPGADLMGGGQIGDAGIFEYNNWRDVLVSVLPTKELAVVCGPGGNRMSLMVHYVEQGDEDKWVARPGALESVEGAALQMVLPAKKDRVRVVLVGDGASSDSLGKDGLLISIDGADGIVKFEHTSELAIIDRKCLGKIVKVEERH